MGSKRTEITGLHHPESDSLELGKLEILPSEAEFIAFLQKTDI